MRLALQFTVLAVAGVLASDVVANAQTAAPSPHVAALKEQYRRAPPRPIENQALVDLGRELFFDPRTSASGKTACVTCHLPNVAWAVLDPRSVNDSGKPTSRKSQTLIGIGHAATPQNGWDGRNATLEAQARSSIAHRLDVDARHRNAGEGRGDRGTRARECRLCRRSSRRRSPARRSTSTRSCEAIAAYRADHRARARRRSTAGSGATRARSRMPPSAASSCSTARRLLRLPLAAGASPTTCSTTSARRTSDRGRGRERQGRSEACSSRSRRRHCVRSRLRPPYMHNASSATLDDSVRHYEKGGIDRPSRSPLMSAIKLTDQERRDLVAFMETLGPGVKCARPARAGELVRQHRAADQAGLSAGHQQGRDGLEQRLVGRVRLEGGAELRLVEQRPEPAGHAAGNVDAAQRLEGEREPAGKAAEQAYEQTRRRLRRRLACERARDDGFGRAARSPADRARARAAPGRGRTARTRHSHARSPSTAARTPRPRPSPADRTRRARPRSRPRASGRRPGRSAATPSPVPGPSTALTPSRGGSGGPSGRVSLGARLRNAQAMASKSFTMRSWRPSEALRQFAAPEPPCPVGERDLLAVDRTGDGQRRRARPRAGFVKVARDRAVEVGNGIVVHDQNALGAAGGIGERKATLAATDVGEEGQAHHVTRSITIS